MGRGGEHGGEEVRSDARAGNVGEAGSVLLSKGPL